jgi:hypothetical protein
MNQIVVIWLICIVLSNLFVISASAANEGKKRVEDAQKIFFNCQIKNVQIIDDHDSDARTVALALTNHCGEEYASWNKLFARYNFDTHNEQRMFSVEQDSDALRIDASIQIVDLHRRGQLPPKIP